MVGIEAAGLMDDLVEEVPEDAEVVQVAVVVEVLYPDGDPENPVRHVLMRCSERDRIKQVGLFELAKQCSMVSGEDDEEDE